MTACHLISWRFEYVPKVCMRAKWPTGLSLCRMKWLGVFLLPPLDGMLVHRGITPSIKIIQWYPIRILCCKTEKCFHSFSFYRLFTSRKTPSVYLNAVFISSSSPNDSAIWNEKGERKRCLSLNSYTDYSPLRFIACLYEKRCHPLRCVTVSRYAVYHLDSIDQLRNTVNHWNLWRGSRR